MGGGWDVFERPEAERLADELLLQEEQEEREGELIRLAQQIEWAIRTCGVDAINSQLTGGVQLVVRPIPQPARGEIRTPF